MNCSEFEAELACWLGDEQRRGTEAQRERLGHLRRHADSCADCATFGELLELTSGELGEPDLFDMPGASYWNDFAERVTARLPQERASRSRSYLRLGSVVAAGLAIALFAWSLVDRQGGALEKAPDRELAERLARGVVAEQDDEGLRVEESDGQWPFAAELSWSDEPTGLYPDVEELSAEEQSAMLDWVRDELAAS